MKNSKIQILLSFAMLFALAWCSSSEQGQIKNIEQENDVIVNDETIQDEKEYDFPKINWWNIKNYGQWWNTLFMELENEYDEPIDAMFYLEYFDEDWNSLWTGQDLLAIAIKPHGRYLVKDNRNVPNAADIKAIPMEAVTQSFYTQVNHKIINEERIWNSVDIDFDIESEEIYEADVFVLFYDWDEIVSFDSYAFFDTKDSYHRYESLENFDHYEVYANIINN